MGLFISKRKLGAVTSSMHQFLPVVRAVFREPPSDVVTEAATVFLYERLTREVFGDRFARRVHEGLTSRFRNATAPEIESRLGRLQRNTDEFRRWEDAWTQPRDDHAKFTCHVRSVIRAMLAEAGQPYDDPGLVKDTFHRFEDAVRRLREHLVGIQRQSEYVMR